MTISHMKELAARFTEHDMIRIHTDLPDFPEFRTRLLFTFLNREPETEKNSELYALVTSLVQLGLDTHDLVPVTNQLKDKPSSRARQLKVLAGDYFSSHYYHLLAEAGEIEMIRHLAASICEVNCQKMNYYSLAKQVKLTAEEHIRRMVTIKSQLFLSFQTWMTGISRRLWPEVLQIVTSCEVLADEINRTGVLESFKGSWGYWHILQSASKEEKKQLQSMESDTGKIRTLLLKYNVKSQLMQLLDTQVDLLAQKIRQFHSDRLSKDLQPISELLTRVLKHPKVQEEF
ncbi:heptaprenyl diphosphate synthase component 1 [Gorillibacterium massiliense]|uniref:heptaprenyl diphosphate synthase component 1 n=1 Tax=Gorillibacterium massiliense TaxID=1280390 RepID=UPI0004BA7E74|nr:heptaprenyl diphosphate synthase component 1 [Gorillibacterium massiliense]